MQLKWALCAGAVKFHIRGGGVVGGGVGVGLEEGVWEGR